MPGNYNGLNGYGMNPWDPRRDPRESTFDGRPVMSTGGSSSGVGTNVSFWAANVGTETSGSILSPSNQNMLVGIKPTVGRVSRYGVIPITADQDTPGPMTRTVSDAAIMLGAMEGAKPDPHDSATTKCPPPAGRDYTKFLNPKGLQGARIGIPRAFFYEKIARRQPRTPRGGLSDAQKKVMDEAIAVLKAQGAMIVDPADIPSIIATDGGENLMNWSVCGGLDNAKGLDASCSIAFKYGMKRDFNAWLATFGDRAPVKTLTELRAWNIAHQRAGAIKYGQANLDVSDEMNVQADRERYEADRRKDIRLSATNGLDAALKANRLDALLFPGVSSAKIGGASGLSDGDGAVGVRAGDSAAGAERVPGGLRAEAAAVQRELHGDGVQRAEADRAGVRVRAGDEEADSAAAVSVDVDPPVTYRGIAEGSEGPLHFTSTSEYIERNSVGGHNWFLLAHLCLVSIDQYWDDQYRPKIAAAQNQPKDSVQLQIMGELRHLRISILHAGGKAVHQLARSELLPRYEPGAAIAIDPQTFLDITFALKRHLREYAGASPGHAA